MIEPTRADLARLVSTGRAGLNGRPKELSSRTRPVIQGRRRWTGLESQSGDAARFGWTMLLARIRLAPTVVSRSERPDAGVRVEGSAGSGHRVCHQVDRRRVLVARFRCGLGHNRLIAFAPEIMTLAIPSSRNRMIKRACPRKQARADDRCAQWGWSGGRSRCGPVPVVQAPTTWPAWRAGSVIVGWDGS